MSSIAKNLFFTLTIISLLALAVFIIQLIVINSSAEPRESGSVVSGGSPGGNADGQEGDGTQGDSDNPFEGYVPPTDPPRPDPEGTRYAITVDSGVSLVVFADDNTFEFVEDDLVWRFEYKGGGSAALEVAFAFISQQNSSSDAERFLNLRTGENNAEFKGTRNIIDSQMSGFNATALVDNVTYEVWFYRLPDNDMDLSLAFMVNYEFNNQRDELYALLSSMSIEQG